MNVFYDKILAIFSVLPLWLLVLNCGAFASMAFFSFSILWKFSPNFCRYLYVRVFDKETLGKIISSSNWYEGDLMRISDRYLREMAYIYFNKWTYMMRLCGKYIRFLRFSLALCAGIIAIDSLVWMADAAFFPFGFRLMITLVVVIVFTFLMTTNKKVRKFFGNALWHLLTVIYFPFVLIMFIIRKVNNIKWLRNRLRWEYDCFKAGIYVRRKHVHWRRWFIFNKFITPFYNLGMIIYEVAWANRGNFKVLFWGFFRSVTAIIYFVLFSAIIWVPIVGILSTFSDVVPKYILIIIGIVAFPIVFHIVGWLASIGAFSQQKTATYNDEPYVKEPVIPYQPPVKTNQDLLQEKFEKEKERFIHNRSRIPGNKPPWEHYPPGASLAEKVRIMTELPSENPPWF